MHHPTKSDPPVQSATAKTALVSEFAKRLRLDEVEENRLRKRLGPIANERDLLLRDAGR